MENVGDLCVIRTAATGNEGTMNIRSFPILKLLLLLVFTVGSVVSLSGVPGKANRKADSLGALNSADVNWPTVGGGYGEEHYSALSHISRSSIGQLGLAW